MCMCVSLMGTVLARYGVIKSTAILLVLIKSVCCLSQGCSGDSHSASFPHSFLPVSTGTSLTVTPHCQRTAGAVGREVRSSERGEPSSLEKFSEEDGSEEDGGRTLFVKGYLVKRMGRILFISV